MVNITKQILTSNPLLKVVALIFGYTFWLILAQNQTIYLKHKIPLSFYIPENKLHLNAPTELTIGITGKRIDLQKLDFANLGAHIDVSKLNSPGQYNIHISPEDIFLPNYVKLIHYSPVIIKLELT